MMWPPHLTVIQAPEIEYNDQSYELSGSRIEMVGPLDAAATTQAVHDIAQKIAGGWSLNDLDSNYQQYSSVAAAVTAHTTVTTVPVDVLGDGPVWLMTVCTHRSGEHDTLALPDGQNEISVIVSDARQAARRINELAGGCVGDSCLPTLQRLNPHTDNWSDPPPPLASAHVLSLTEPENLPDMPLFTQSPRPAQHAANTKMTSCAGAEVAADATSGSVDVVTLQKAFGAVPAVAAVATIRQAADHGIHHSFIHRDFPQTTDTPEVLLGALACAVAHLDTFGLAEAASDKAWELGYSAEPKTVIDLLQDPLLWYGWHDAQGINETDTLDTLVRQTSLWYVASKLRTGMHSVWLHPERYAGTLGALYSNAWQAAIGVCGAVDRIVTRVGYDRTLQWPACLVRDASDPYTYSIGLRTNEAELAATLLSGCFPSTDHFADLDMLLSATPAMKLVFVQTHLTSSDTPATDTLRVVDVLAAVTGALRT
jgi:hypothetical protein